MPKTDIAKLFKNGRSQAVRLPREFRFEGDRVRIRMGNLTMTNHPMHLHGHEFVVTGTFKDWTCLTIGPIVPHDDVHFVVVGCHLAPTSRSDIRGAAWFDDLWMGELPLFSLDSNFQTQFREHDSPVVITSHVDGLDPRRTYRLDIEVNDAEGKRVAATAFDLSRKPAEAAPSAPGKPAEHRTKKEKPREVLPGLAINNGST